MSDMLKSRLLTAFLSASSIVLSFGLAFYWSLEKPFWAGFTAMVISLSTIGQSAQKALLRISGTAVGAVTGLALLAMAEQHHWLLLSLLFLYVIAMVFFMVTSQYNNYFFYTAAIVCVIIIVGSLHDNISPFQFAVARLEETILGIAVYSCLALFLWPRSALDSLRGNLQRIATMHQQIFQAQLASVTEADTPFELQLYMQGIRLLKTSESLLPAARLESYTIRKRHQDWISLFRYSHMLLQSQNTLANLLQHFNTTQLHTLFPRFDQEYALLERQYDNLAQHRKAETSPATPILTMDDARLHELSILEQHIVHRIAHEYARQMECCTALNEYIRYVLTESAPHPARRAIGSEPSQDLMTLKQLEESIKAAAIYWSSVLLWIYVNPPGIISTSFVEMSIVVGLVGILAGDLAPLQVIGSFFGGCLLAMGVYFGIMPMLHNFEELGLLLFCLIFAVTFCYYLPAQGLIRTGLLTPLFALTGLTNTRTFAPAIFFSGALSLMCCAALLALVYYIFTGDHPAHRLFIRQRRFFYAASRYLAYLAAYPAARRFPLQRLAAAWHARELRDLPQSLLELAFKFEETERGLVHQSVKQVALNAHALAREILSLDVLKDTPSAGDALSLLPDMDDVDDTPRQRLAALWKLQGIEHQIRDLHIFARRLELRLGLADRSEDLLTEHSVSFPSSPGQKLPQDWRKTYIGLLNALYNTVGSAEKVDWDNVNVLEF